MWLDVVDLKNFYNSVLGKNAQKLVAQSIRMVWPNVNSQSVMGLGYAIPFLDIFQTATDPAVRDIERQISEQQIAARAKAARAKSKAKPSSFIVSLRKAV